MNPDNNMPVVIHTNTSVGYCTGINS